MFTSTDEVKTEDADALENPVAQADSDAQLFSTLCEIDPHNYIFVFKRCKLLKVNARQLLYLRKEHIRELIPKTNLGVLAEFEYFLEKWQLKNGFEKAIVSTSEPTIVEPTLSIVQVSVSTMTTSICTNTTGTNTEPIDFPKDKTPQSLLEELTSVNDSKNLNNSRGTGYDERETNCSGKFLLTNIIPTVLEKCQQKYKANQGLLTEPERRQLSGAIIEYFLSRKIHLKADIIDNLAEQIEGHFPTESKRAWYDRKNCKGRGRLYVKLYNAHRFKVKSPPAKKRRSEINSEAQLGSSEALDTPEYDEEAEQIQNWLRTNKCEDINEVISMWQDTLSFRGLQLRRMKTNCEDSISELLNNWPAYKNPEGHLLLALDFQHMHPLSLAAFDKRWPVYMTKIVTLMEAELKDGASVELFKLFKATRHTLSQDSSQCTLINLLHAIMKPSRCFNTPQGVRRFCITDSQNNVLRLISNHSEIDNHDNTTHPCIYAVGESLLRIEECFVVYRDLRYRLKFSEALSATMQIYAVFRIGYPLPTLNFWQFVRGYFFDIQFESETSYAVMDNVVKYLETSVEGREK